MVLPCNNQQNMATKAVVLPANTGHPGCDVSPPILGTDHWTDSKVQTLCGQTVGAPQMASADSFFINRLQALVTFRSERVLQTKCVPMN